MMWVHGVGFVVSMAITGQLIALKNAISQKATSAKFVRLLAHAVKTLALTLITLCVEISNDLVLWLISQRGVGRVLLIPGVVTSILDM